MNFDATKKIKHCYTRTIAKKKLVVTQELTIKKCCNKMYYTLPKKKYQEEKFGTNLYESKLIKDQLMDKWIIAIVAWGHATTSVGGYVESQKCSPYSYIFPLCHNHLALIS